MKENLEIIVALIAIFSAAGGLLWRLHRKYVKPFLLKIDNIDKQFRPNGGSSFHDKLTRVDGKIDGLDDHLKILTKVFNSTLYLDPNPIFKADAKGSCIFVNYAWLKLTGYTGQEEAYGIGWINAIYQEDKALVLDEWERCVETESLFNMQYRYMHRVTKEITKVHCRTTVIRDTKKKAIQIIGLVEVLL